MVPIHIDDIFIIWDNYNSSNDTTINMIKIIIICAFLFLPINSIGQKNIYIYHDSGVSEEAYMQTQKTFKTLFKQRNIVPINAYQVKRGLWRNHALLFVIPGGADVPYINKLHGQGDFQIKTYVKNGGSFIGICAGAYYASKHVIFDQGGPLEIIGDRHLAFFKGTSIGPVYGPYYYQSQQSSRAIPIFTKWRRLKETTVFYNGGGYFKNAQQYPNTQVIAKYANHSPAIIYISYGKGHALLSGVHFEYNPDALDIQNKYIKAIYPKLNRCNPSRLKLLDHLMNLIHLNPTSSDIH